MRFYCKKTSSGEKIMPFFPHVQDTKSFARLVYLKNSLRYNVLSFFPMEVWYNFLTLVLFQSLTHQIENRTDGSSDFATTYHIFCRFFKDVPTLPTNWKYLLKDFSFKRALNEFCLDSCKIWTPIWTFFNLMGWSKG